LVYAAALVICTIIYGVADNASVPSLKVWINNFWVYVPFCAATEVFRVFIIKNSKELPYKTKIFTWIFLTAVYTFVQLETLRSFGEMDSVGKIDQIITMFLPQLMFNVMMVPIAMYSGLWTCFILRAIFTLTPILLPVLPNTRRITWAIMVYAALFVIYLLFDRFLFSVELRPSVEKKIKETLSIKHSPLGWLYTVMLVGLVTAFGLKLFPIFPAAVATGSMTPSIPRGSMVMIKKVPQSEIEGTIKIGDVVNYKIGKATVIHRVIAINTDNLGNVLYTTKGDNNPVKDVNPVEATQILGTANWYIPYLGFPAVIIQGQA
jgi:signal peptidase